MKVLFAASEVAPWVKTGGLGDVASSLPKALRAEGLDVRLLVPGYPAMLRAFAQAKAVAEVPGCRLREGEAGGVPIYLVECPSLYERPGGPYVDETGQDWPDNALRFGLLARVAARLAGPDTPLDWRPDVLHCNDWQSALAPALLRTVERPGGAASVVTVHNLAFAGSFDPAVRTALGLPESLWSPEGVEFYGRLSFLKGGLQLADAITTVSPTYAREVQTDELGMGFGGLLRHRAADLEGILNGADTEVWNPARDALLWAPYSASDLAGKAVNRAKLCEQAGWKDDPAIPLLGMVGRMTHQKGCDLVLAAAGRILGEPARAQCRLVVVGSGDPVLEEGFRALARARPDAVRVDIGFDEARAHRIEAGADMFLMPSRFEPCGLNQMYSLLYGTPPLARRTGGLADTIVDAPAEAGGTGFLFEPETPEALAGTVERAFAEWRDRPRWRRRQANGMAADFSWAASAKRYAALYARLAARGPAGGRRASAS